MVLSEYGFTMWPSSLSMIYIRKLYFSSLKDKKITAVKAAEEVNSLLNPAVNSLRSHCLQKHHHILMIVFRFLYLSDILLYVSQNQSV
jgi:hypothetical protein